jgi:GAF domain-containing protein
MHMLVNPYLRQWGPKSVALAPLPRLGDPRGIIAVYSKQPGSFGDSSSHMMALASQIALGLQGAQGDAVAVEANHAWAAAVDIGKTIRTIDTAAAAAEAWVQGARDAFSTVECGVYLQTPLGDVQRTAGFGSQPDRFDPDACRAWVHEECCAQGAGCTGCRAHGGIPGHVCMPLIWQQDRIGLVTIQAPSQAYWTENRLQLLTVMTELLSVALAGIRSSAKRLPTDPLA